MLRRLRPRSIYDVMATIGCFAALATGTAYAANTIRSTDIVDGEVKSVDVANQDLTGGDIKDNSISSFDVGSLVGDDVVDGTLTSADIQNGSLGNGDFLTGSVDSRVLADDSIGNGDLLTGSVDGRTLTDDSISTLDIANGGLLDKDVGESVIRNFVGNIGVVPAGTCVDRGVSQGALALDHLLLTPSHADANVSLVYTVKYDPDIHEAWINVCNWTNAAINDGNTHFNLLAFNARA